jgi:hypothetical protein
LFQNLLLNGPASSAATHFSDRHEGKSLHNLTQVVTLVFGKFSIRIPAANTPNFFLVAFLKLSGQMSEYYIQFGHGRFLPYAVTGGFVERSPVTTGRVFTLTATNTDISAVTG